MPEVLLWVESVVGGGHLRVADQLAAAMMSSGLDVHVVTGSHHRFPGLTYGGATIHPYDESLRIHYDAHEGYTTSQGIPLASAPSVLEARAKVFLHIADRICPDAILTEHWPFGRGNMNAEVLGAISEIKRVRPDTLVYGSVRDVMLVSDGDCAGGSPESATNIINRYFERIFVHGDPTFIPFEATFPLADRIWNKITYTGYLVHPMPPPKIMLENERPVLVSSGGGKTEDGFQLYTAAILSKSLLPKGHHLEERPWHILVSDAYTEERFLELQRLATAAGTELIVSRNMLGAEFREAVSNAALCISLSGYNTVIETYAAGVPAVLLPLYNAAQGQLFRANAFSRLGKMIILPYQYRRDPHKLLQFIDKALERRNVIQPELKLNGEKTVASLISLDLKKKASSTLTVVPHHPPHLYVRNKTPDFIY